MRKYIAFIPTPVFLIGESQGWGSLVGCHLWGCKESDVAEALSIVFFFFFKLFIYLFIYLFVVNFVIHWNETAMGLHVFPIPIPPPTSLSTRSP